MFSMLSTAEGCKNMNGNLSANRRMQEINVMNKSSNILNWKLKYPERQGDSALHHILSP
jgi:hypothetical protein